MSDLVYNLWKKPPQLWITPKPHPQIKNVIHNEFEKSFFLHRILTPRKTTYPQTRLINFLYLSQKIRLSPLSTPLIITII